MGGDQPKNEQPITPLAAAATDRDLLSATTQEAARAYLAAGLEPLPLAPRSKRPARGWKWTERRIRTDADVDENF